MAPVESLRLSEAFAALAELLRLRPGAQQEAARLVLVEGLGASEADRRCGISRQAVGNTLRACRRGLGLAGIAASSSA